MRSLIAILALFVATTASAQETVIKQCTVNFEVPEEQKDPVGPTKAVVDFKLVSQADGTISAMMRSKDGDDEITDTQSVEIVESKVRAGLKADSDTAGLNIAEIYIVHAMAVAEDPVLGQNFSAGVDLQKVRSAKLYLIGDPIPFFGIKAALLEAKDENNNDLGTFFSALIVAPCK